MRTAALNFAERARGFAASSAADGVRAPLNSSWKLGAAVVSTGVGLSVLFSRPSKPEEPKVGVGVSPMGVVVSGNFR